MSMFKKCKVVMLPTNQKVINTKEYQLLLSNSLFWTSKIEIERYSEGWFFLNNSSNPNSCAITVPNVENFKHQHLYIISDDKIKLFDWVYNNKENIVEQITSKTQLIFVLEENKENQTFKKIIATTDTSLKTTISPYSFPEGGVCKSKDFYLLQPSKQFIEKYIEEYNKGNIITDVLVEYELISNEEYFGNTVNPDDDVPYFDEKLKINPKDNTITIKKVKDSYTREEVDRLLDEQASRTTAEMLEKFKGYKSREEVIEFGNKVKEYCKNGWKLDSLHMVFFEWDKWIEENL